MRYLLPKIKFIISHQAENSIRGSEVEKGDKMIDAAAILEFLEDDLGIDVSTVASDTALFSSGILDSFSLVNLMMFVEERGDFRIKSMDVNLENLDSIDKIIAFVSRCTQHEHATS
jgi:acyl carrier protein